MTRWLSTINNLLDKLDGQVGVQIQERATERASHSDDDNNDYELSDTDVQSQDSDDDPDEQYENEQYQAEGSQVSEQQPQQQEEEVDFDAFDDNDNFEAHNEETGMIDSVQFTAPINEPSGLSLQVQIARPSISVPDPLPALEQDIEPGQITPSHPSTVTGDEIHEASNEIQNPSNEHQTSIDEIPTAGDFETNIDQGAPVSTDQGGKIPSEDSVESSTVDGPDTSIEDMGDTSTGEEVISIMSESAASDQSRLASTPEKQFEAQHDSQESFVNIQENDSRLEEENLKLEEQNQLQDEEIHALKEIIHNLEKDLQQQTLEHKKHKAATKEKLAKLSRTHKHSMEEVTADLEHAEQEMQAQRHELERAAQRMERDRLRHKEELARLAQEHAQAMRAMQHDHEAAIQGLAAAHSEQLKELQERLKQQEEARLQEGGDWEGELHRAMELQQETLKKSIALEDEKATLTSQLSLLQNQITMLETRVTSLSSALESSQQREREAENKLDTALSTQARALQQRQARESELEKTCAELGAALVLAKQREQERDRQTITQKGESSDERNAVSATRVKALEEQVEMLTMQLEMERKHSATIKEELQSAAQERSDEAVSSLTKQRQHERQVTELQSRVSQLEQQIRDMEQVHVFSSQKSESDSHLVQLALLKDEMSSLSNQIIRQQEKLDRQATETVALRSRLRAALNRAEEAEKSANDTSNAGVPRLPARLRRSRKEQTESIRVALHLDSNYETIGQVVDAMDKLTLETGAMIQANGLTRAFFIFYWIVLHSWTFILLFYHTHNDSMHDSASEFLAKNSHESGQHLFLPGVGLRGARAP